MNDIKNKEAELDTISYTELVQAKPGEAFFHEWNTYLREVGRLLREGHQGKFILINDEAIIGIFDTEDAARTEGLKRCLLQPFLVQQIRSREPILRIRGYNVPWPVSRSQLAKPA
jgi:hypothetical protein